MFLIVQIVGLNLRIDGNKFKNKVEIENQETFVREDTLAEWLRR